MKGPAGSKVELTLAKDGTYSGGVVSSATNTVNVTRQKYTLVPVRSKLCAPAAAAVAAAEGGEGVGVGEGVGKRVGYIRLSTFNSISGSKVKEAVKTMTKEG